MRIRKEEALALVVDIQEKLCGHIYNHDVLLKNTTLLLQGLKALDVPCIINEQYKKGLGNTVEAIETLVCEDAHFEKVSFSCVDNPETKEAIEAQQKKYAILMGMETHVCVLQTSLDLLTLGMQPVVVVDAVGSRKEADHEVALQRLAHAGVILTSYESILFELCQSAKNPAFKTISQLVK